MPLSYYFADNFFKKMTDLDSPRRNNDCYFYYYSTCNKGDSCTFRHEPSALGCETVCSFWKEGKCLNVHCNYRHMELRKNRKAIQCYWETQPTGCLKPHCPFFHQNAGQSTPNDNTSANNSRSTEDSENIEEVPQSPNQNGIEGTAAEKNFRSQVDSLVVSFEEESDTESIPTKSPIKHPVKKVRVKTLEDIKLERIQEESAAYFAYSLDQPDTGEDLRRNLTRKRKRLDDSLSPTKVPRLDSYTLAETFSNSNDSNLFSKFNNISQESIVMKDSSQHSKVTKLNDVKDHGLTRIKSRGIKKNNYKEEKGLDTIKIKTLEEIRAEKKRRMAETSQEISSTTKDDEQNIQKPIEHSLPKKKLKLQRLPSIDKQEEYDSSSTKLEDNQKQETEKSYSEKPLSASCENSNERIYTSESILHNPTKTSEVEPTSVDQNDGKLEAQEESKDNENKSIYVTEEMLLLEEDLDYEDDGLMNEIDSILSK